MVKVTRWGKYGNPYKDSTFREPDKSPGVVFHYWGAWTTEREAEREKKGLKEKGGRQVRVQYRPGPKPGQFVYVVFASLPKHRGTEHDCPYCHGFIQYFQGKRVCRDCEREVPLKK